MRMTIRKINVINLALKNLRVKGKSGKDSIFSLAELTLCKCMSECLYEK